MLPELAIHVANRDWGIARQFILQQQSKSRESVGLSTETDLTPLQTAALYEPEVAQRMLDTNIPLDLHSACALGRVDAVAQLANPDSLSAEADMLPPIAFALLREQMECLIELLRNGDDPNRQLARIGFFVWEVEVAAEAVWQPIHLPSTHGYMAKAPEMIDILLDHGADMDTLSPLGERSLSLAATYGWPEVIAKLIERGADVNERSSSASDLVSRLSSPGETESCEGQTPVMVAAREGSVDTVNLLIKHGAKLNVTDTLGKTVLHVAAKPWWEENVELVRKLLQEGCDPNVKDAKGRKPIEIAQDAGYAETAELLQSWSQSA